MHTSIVKDKLFSLETLNSRIRLFDYGIKTSANISPVISVDTIKKGHLIYSASEMACFVQNLGLIIGDLVPKENKTWKIYILLREIFSIILAPTVTLENITALKSLLTKHYRLHMKLVDDTLKPKHHLLLHYPHAMVKMGPVRQMSCMRFEAKHKELKDVAKAITSRTNPAYSLSFK